MTVADRIRDRRNEIGMSQAELARLIGTKDRSTISQIENSGDNITMKNIIRIAEALDVSSHYLLGWQSKEEMEQKKDFQKLKDLADKKLAIEEMEASGFSHEQIAGAIKLFEKYKNATPEIQAAVELLLKSAQQKP